MVADEMPFAFSLKKRSEGYWDGPIGLLTHNTVLTFRGRYRILVREGY
jgi:hypothetical protein